MTDDSKRHSIKHEIPFGSVRGKLSLRLNNGSARDDARVDYWRMTLASLFGDVDLVIVGVAVD